MRGMDNRTKRGVKSDIDRGWAWMVCFACFIIHVIFDGIYFSVGVIFVEFLDYFGQSKGDTAVVVSLCFGVAFLLGPLFAYLSDRFGCRTVVILGGAVSSSAYILSIFSPNVYCLYVTFGIMAGFGYGCVYLPSILSVNFYFEKRRALATGLGVCGNGFGLMIFGPLTKHLIDVYTWKGAVLIQSGILLHAVACGLVYRPLNVKRVTLSENGREVDVDTEAEKERLYSPPEANGVETVTCIIELNEQHNSNTDERGVDNDTEQKENTLCMIGRVMKSNFKKVLGLSVWKNKAFVLLLFGSSLCDTSYVTPYVFLPDKAENDGIDGFTAAWLVSTIGLSNLTGRLIWGAISDIKCINRIYVSIGNLFICGLSMAAMPFFHASPPLFVCCAFFGFSLGGLVTLNPVIVRDLVELDNMPEAFGILNFSWGIAFLVGQPIIGWLFDISGTYSTSFISAGLTTMTGGVILGMVPVCGLDPSRRKSN